MRVLLINPPSPEQLGSPLLGLEYVAASLLANGCEVRIIDGAARHFGHDSEWIAKEADSFAPRIIGVSLSTRWVWHCSLPNRSGDQVRLSADFRYGFWSETAAVDWRATTIGR